MYAPVSGIVVAVNEALADNPQLLNDDPYGEGWLIEIEAADAAEFEALLDAGAYRSLTEGLTAHGVHVLQPVRAPQPAREQLLLELRVAARHARRPHDHADRDRPAAGRTRAPTTTS